MTNKISLLLLTTFMIVFTGCAGNQYTYGDLNKVQRVSIGKVIEIKKVEVSDDGVGTGVGAILGAAILGGLTGDKKAAVAGAVVGGVVGNQVRSSNNVQELTVRLKDTSTIMLLNNVKDSKLVYEVGDVLKLVSSGDKVIKFEPHAYGFGKYKAMKPVSKIVTKGTPIVTEKTITGPKEYNQTTGVIKNKTSKNNKNFVKKTKPYVSKVYEGEIIDYNIIGQGERGQIAQFEIMDSKTFTTYKLKATIFPSEFFTQGDLVKFQFTKPTKTTGKVWIKQ